MLSGRIGFASFSGNGRIYRWLSRPSPSACPTHTNSPFFVLWKRYAASLAIPKRGASRLFAAQKNRLQQLRANALWLVRQEASTSSRPLLWRHSHLSGNRNPAGGLSVLRQGETRTARLSGGQPALYQALCLVCGQAVSRQHGVGHRPRIAFGLAHRRGCPEFCVNGIH